MNDSNVYRLLVLDWGIGGLPLFQKLTTALPGTPMMYLSDSGNVPYGKQDSEQLQNRLTEIARFAGGLEINTIAVACNAMSSILPSLASSIMSVEILSLIHSFFSRPLPAKSRIGIIGGYRTIQSGIYQRAFEDAGNIVSALPTQELSALIEAGNFDEVPSFLEKTFSRLGDMDALVLACTHYPAVSSIIQFICPELTLIDPGYVLFEECMKRMGSDFPEKNFAALELCQNKSGSMHTYYTTGDEALTIQSAGKAFGFYHLPFKKIPLNLRI